MRACTGGPLALLATLVLAAPAHGGIERASVANDGAEANGMSHDPAISADGRFVAFSSLATNLVAGDMNGYSDVFVRDRRTGRTTRVSVSSRGRQGNRGSFGAAISASGRHVAFCSYASNLAGRDKVPRGLRNEEVEPYRDVFVHDRATGRTRMVSRGSRQSLRDDRRTPRAGSCAPSISDDGRTVAYLVERTRMPVSDLDRPLHVMVWSARTGRRRQVDVDRRGRSANGDAGAPAVSGDGRFVAFTSGATDLVAGDTNGSWDAFVARPATRRVRRVSTTHAGAQVAGDSLGPVDVSRDGRLVAFVSYARALHSRAADEFADAYVKDLRSGAVDFASAAATGEEPAGPLLSFAMSPDGRHVTFATDAADVAPGDADGWSDVFVRDRSERRTVEASAGEPSHELGSPEGDVAAGGRAVAFTSYAWTLVPADANGAADIFVRTP